MRKARQFVWVDPDDCDPPHSLDMNWPHDYEKVKYLIDFFRKEGFDTKKACLVGYPLNGRIQLLSGTHRHMAAKIAGVKIPVSLWLRDDVMRRWGTDEWLRLIQDIPVNELEQYPVLEGKQISEHEPVEITYA